MLYHEDYFVIGDFSRVISSRRREILNMGFLIPFTPIESGFHSIRNDKRRLSFEVRGVIAEEFDAIGDVEDVLHCFIAK